MTTTAQAVRCVNCGAGAGVEDRFCGICGAAISSTISSTPLTRGQFCESPEEADLRRRLGGTQWQPKGRPVTVTAGGSVTSNSSTSSKLRRRKKRRRAWYRRKRFAVPSVAFLVLLFLACSAFYRAESTLSSVRGLSTPPSTISGDQFGENATLTVDTGPATEALASAGVKSKGGGLLDGIKGAAHDGADLAKGAAVAAGVTKASADGRTILIMGVDARPGTPIDVSVRADVLIVAHINPSAGTCRMLAIPRDTRTNLPGYGLTKINHALLVGGIPYQKLVVEQTLGVQIDAYALIDFTGFKDLVDAVGGVDITVKQEFTYQNVQFTLGPRHMTGKDALLFVRYRGGVDGDVGRIRRQQQLIRALMASTAGKKLASDPGQILSALEQHVRTDVGAGEAVSLVDQYSRICSKADVEMDVLQGRLVTPYDQQEPDPILKRKEYYNVVTTEQIQSKVRVLLGD
jgi:LCP family protein required for cell wall assembly